MNYKDYQKARNATWRILIDLGIHELPIMPSSICKSLGIAVKRYDPTDGNDGKSFCLDGQVFVLVNRNCEVPRQRFTVAHELGHIILGHVGRFELVNREPHPTDNPIEQAANVFASRLLAPACVLWGCNARTSEEIAALCSISQQAASFRAQRMEVLYKRNRFLTSPLEQQVYLQFEDYIARHKL